MGPLSWSSGSSNWGFFTVHCGREKGFNLKATKHAAWSNEKEEVWHHQAAAGEMMTSHKPLSFKRNNTVIDLKEMKGRVWRKLNRSTSNHCWITLYNKSGVENVHQQREIVMLEELRSFTFSKRQQVKVSCARRERLVLQTGQHLRTKWRICVLSEVPCLFQHASLRETNSCHSHGGVQWV